MEEEEYKMMNKVILTGRIAREPELKTSAAGVPVCRFSVAVERKGNNNKADFFPVVCFYGTAEFIHKYFEKGQAVTLCGSLQNRDWEEADGTRRHVTEILAREAYFCGGRERKPSAAGRAEENKAQST